jgi:hypothetical protein
MKFLDGNKKLISFQATERALHNTINISWQTNYLCSYGVS